MNMKAQIARKSLLLFLAGTWMITTGFTAIGKTPVELKSDKPLIDLDVLVTDSLPGKFGNEESGLSGITEETAVEGETVSPEESMEEESREAGTVAVTQIRITVQDTGYRVNGTECRDAEDMLSRVRELYKVGLKVCLVDDYAQYAAYKKAYQLLRAENISLIEETVE